MKHALEFEKPLIKAQEELEELRKRQLLKNTQKISMAVTEQEKKVQQLQSEIFDKLNAWQRVQIARHLNRPYMLDYAKLAFEEFLELHGDRHIGDDNAMPAGFATIGGRQVVLIGQQKGRDTKENLLRNFGSAHPEGYRKALRLMRLAEKFSLPVITLIDTPGAYPGIGAEERNIAEAIAFNLLEMMKIRTPMVSVVIGEGGSGGALGIGVTDRVLMMENAYYSVISPEGCAAILWKHRSHAPEAAEALKLSAPDLKELGIIDGIIPEPPLGAHHNHHISAANLKAGVLTALDQLENLPIDILLQQRYEKFRAFGKVAGG
jgi:acetyl-CoA carboxylase carboxyl transferase subunit alpha